MQKKKDDEIFRKGLKSHFRILFKFVSEEKNNLKKEAVTYNRLPLLSF